MPGSASHALDGTPIGDQSHGASHMAAAGDHDDAERLPGRGEQADSSEPTYYGSAWVALGWIMLTSSALGSCPEWAGSTRCPAELPGA
jgi:endoglucanase